MSYPVLRKQVEPPEKEFMVCALDLLSGMSEGLGGGFGPLLASSNLLQMLLQVQPSVVVVVSVVGGVWGAYLWVCLSGE